MSLHNFRDECRPVTVAGRPFTVWAPRVGTVEAVLELYPAEIEALLQVAARITEPLVPLSVLPVFTADPVRAARVLRTCVAPDPDGLPAGALEELAAAVLGACDAGRIVAGLGLQPAGPNMPAGDTAVDQRAGIVNLALRFGVTPFEVLGWPYEGFLDILETLPLIDGTGEAARMRELEGQHHPDFVAAMRAAAGKVN